MNIYLLILAVIILFVGIIILFVIPRKSQKIIITTVTGIIIVLSTIFCIYSLDAPLRQEINMRFNTVSHHRCTLDNQSFYLPLPNKTILNYRISDTHAVYITKASFDEIWELYSSVAENNSILMSIEEEKIKLSFKYQDKIFSVIVEDNIKNRRISISVD